MIILQIGLLGKANVGKSTLMNIVGCLDSPTNGNYFLNGVDVSSMDDDKLSSIRNSEIGFVFFMFVPGGIALLSWAYEEE